MSQGWLQDLEQRVQEASSLLRELRGENEKLQQRVEDLEEQLAAAAESDSAAWTEERDEIRQRVEKLVEHHDELLKE